MITLSFQIAPHHPVPIGSLNRTGEAMTSIN